MIQYDMILDMSSLIYEIYTVMQNNYNVIKYFLNTFSGLRITYFIAHI